MYRARDTRLGRDVAIKVLPAEVAGDAEWLARSRREAHLLASLNHPGIAATYGLEEVEGKPFLVLELVDGETQEERVARESRLKKHWGWLGRWRAISGRGREDEDVARRRRMPAVVARRARAVLSFGPGDHEDVGGRGADSSVPCADYAPGALRARFVAGDGTGQKWTISRDGQRFLLSSCSSGAAARRANRAS